MKPNVQLISEGMGYGTRVISDAGTEIKGITEVQVSIKPGDVVRMVVEFGVVALDVEGYARFKMSHPETGELVEVSRIEFVGGGSWSAPQ